MSACFYVFLMCSLGLAWASTCRDGLSEADLYARLLDPKRSEAGACVRIQGCMSKGELQRAESRFRSDGEQQASVLVVGGEHLAFGGIAAAAAQVADVFVCFSDDQDLATSMFSNLQYNFMLFVCLFMHIERLW